MMSQPRKIVTFGAAAALAVAVGFGGAGVGLAGNTPATTAHTSAHVVPAPASAGVHTATLSDCVSGLDC